jgi:hypothetical protein
MKNTISSFTSLQLINPYSDRGLEDAQNALIPVTFSVDVYPKKIIKELIETSEAKGTPIKPPKCIFLPNKQMIRQMIRAAMKWGKTDTEEAFLLRFGLLDDPNWYLKPPF